MTTAFDGNPHTSPSTGVLPLADPQSDPPRPRGRLTRFVLGPTGHPLWARPTLLSLLCLTALLYLWNLSATGWGNSFYAAAGQAGSQSWKALLFGSLDAGNAITVDKPPAAMWILGLSVRFFGLNSWAVLAPQALMGVASVGLLYATVRRWFGPAAGLLAGTAFALTPVAVLIFRYDNPDALLVLLMVAGAYCTVRAVETASWRWLALAGTALGFGFLTKMMQAFLVLPAFALVYLLAAPTGIGARIRHLLIAGAALVVSAGWFVALVAIWPAGSRPYIAGSTDNSEWQLAIGYNGLSRILGETAAGNGGLGGGGRDGADIGIGRLFGATMGTEISWLLPAALIALVAIVGATWTAPRTDKTRAAAILWGGWLLLTGLTFSFMNGIIHEYYNVALAPAIGALVGIGTHVLWRRRDRVAARIGLTAMVLATTAWASLLLGRTGWLPGLRWATLAIGTVAALTLLGPAVRLRRLIIVAVTAALVSAGAGTGAYAVATAATSHTGPTPVSGPAGIAGEGGHGQGGPPGTAGAPGGVARTGQGNGGENSVSAEVVALLAATDTRWSAAVTRTKTAADLELASGTPIIGMGGWMGSDPSPTLAQFQQYVAAGDIHYFIGGGGDNRDGGGSGGPGGTATESSQIAAWVAAHYTATSAGTSTIYDLTQAATK